MEKLLTIKQVADILSISRSTVYRWIQEERLPIINLRRKGARRVLRIEHWALMKYIKNGRRSNGRSV
jgi:excisionase family DNA binding protein